MAETRMVGVLLHLAESGFGDVEVLAFLSAWADEQGEATNLVAARLRTASSLLAGTASPRDHATVDQWIELLAALEAWHHLRAAFARSGKPPSRRPRPLRARP